MGKDFKAAERLFEKALALEVNSTAITSTSHHSHLSSVPLAITPPRLPEREFFIDNLLVRVHLFVEMILVDRPCAIGVWDFVAAQRLFEKALALEFSRM